MPYLICILAIFIFQSASATCLDKDVIKNEYIVMTSPLVSTSFSTKTSNLSFKTRKISSSSKNLLNKVKSLSLSKTSEETKETYLISTNDIESFKRTHPNAHVQKNCRVNFFNFVNTNDPLVNFQDWYLESLNSPEAADLNSTREIIVAVSDTGVDIDHEDIQGNLWQNTAELNGITGVDDDQNGYIDDVYGFDFGDRDSNPKPSFSDAALDFDHGSHVAGLVAARTDNSVGVSSLSHNNIKVMSLKGFKSNNPSSMADLLESIYYAVDNGAHVINASWGVEKSPEAAEVQAVNYAVKNNVVIVAAAGNDRVPASWFIPAGLKNVVTVASVNSSNQLSTFSNYGDVVDFIAPGGDSAEGSGRFTEKLLSLGLGSQYLELSGTSMAAPLVASSIGLILSQNSELTPYQAVHVLKQSGSNYSLRPYLQSNNQQNYVKPNVVGALNYLNSNNEIPEINPVLEDVSAFSRDLASNNNSGGGGCSNSLSGQSVDGIDSINSGSTFFILMFFMMPILTISGIKKGL